MAHSCVMAPGVPVKPMLARICKGPEDALSILGPGAFLAGQGRHRRLMPGSTGRAARKGKCSIRGAFVSCEGSEGKGKAGKGGGGGAQPSTDLQALGVVAISHCWSHLLVTPAGHTCAEYKYDGRRAQIHLLRDGQPGLVWPSSAELTPGAAPLAPDCWEGSQGMPPGLLSSLHTHPTARAAPRPPAPLT
ncbi:hypothetical protein HaLaN_00929 [Haematococcus lacustris]|uniref:ATP-dependent DNA ligase family profile domain-containing protein n=1 Tax=Haematococcus lacustris TaxID=44745 RepID=A0A699YK22_HAELA|nr:hypothetical protein HaLaN_00929 [Haematococcus lacustris]